MDESSDMSNDEQLSLSLSSENIEGKKSENFVWLIKVPQTTGEYLCETLVKNLKELGLDTRRVATELNRRILKRAELSEITVTEGDSLEVVHFVGGG